MSVEILRLLPRDPGTPVPPEGIRSATVRKLRELLPGAASVLVSVSEEIVFFDQGEGFESVGCPNCGRALSQDWWSDAFSAALESRFVNRVCTTHCCHAELDLNDLEYDWPTGFGRFAVEIAEPGTTTGLGGSEIAGLEAVLGCQLKQGWARY